MLSQVLLLFKHILTFKKQIYENITVSGQFKSGSSANYTIQQYHSMASSPDTKSFKFYHFARRLFRLALRLLLGHFSPHPGLSVRDHFVQHSGLPTICYTHRTDKSVSLFLLGVGACDG